MSSVSRRLKSRNLHTQIEANEDRLFKYFISYALLLLFVVVSVFSTDDLHLLQVKQGIELPLISANTSIIGFYVIATMIVCAASIFIAREFHILEKIKQRVNQRSSFVFSYASQPNDSQTLLGFNGSLDRIVLNIISRLVFFVTGPTVLALLLFRFADFQDRIIFGAQLAMMLFATYLSYVFYKRTDRLHAHQNSIAMRIVIGIVALPMILKVLVCIDVIYFPPEYSPSFFLKQNTFLLDDEDGGTKSWIPHIKIERNVNIWQAEAKGQFVEIAYQNGSPDVNNYFINRGFSIDIRRRRVRFLDIQFQISPRLWAHNADLSGANLSFTKLAGSNFIATNLYAANFAMATLDGSRFAQNNLEHSIWSNARVRGAFFDNSRFRFSDLSGAQFLGSIFLGVNITNSNMAYVNFDAVTLIESTLTDNAVLFDSKAKVFQPRLHAKNIIDRELEFFDTSDIDAISALVREFCVEKLTAPDLTALDTLSSSYGLLFPSRIAQVSSAFERGGCQSARSAWTVETRR